MRTGRRPGFTLIELLVVLSILIILAAILFPVFAQIREHARQAVCISNLKQIATGMQLYCDDYDHRFPRTLGWNGDDQPRFPDTWMGQLEPYVKGTAIFLDPASGRGSPDWRASRDLMVNYSFPPSSRVGGHDSTLVVAEPYGTALWEGLGGFSGPPIGGYLHETPSCSPEQVARPAETIMLCDQKAFDWGLLTRHFYYPDPRHRKQPDLVLPDGVIVPQGWINAAFVDGHVRALRHEQFWEILPHASPTGSPWGVFRYFWPSE
jgi:prepilin-type N-terminal cleavage/methylation domain-containing protein/prepilin-type processing-associated H-X9-DG protein